MTKQQPELQTLKFTRVVFGVLASPFLSNFTIRHNPRKYLATHPELVKRILESIYVDNVVSGAKTEEEAFTMYRETRPCYTQEASISSSSTQIILSCESTSTKRRAQDILAQLPCSIQTKRTPAQCWEVPNVWQPENRRCYE